MICSPNALLRCIVSLLMGGLLSCAKPKEAPSLNIYNWANYIGASTIQNFENEFHVKVHYDNFSSNEELLTKLQAGAGGYDVIFPSDYMVRIMIAQGLLSPLDRSKLPNLANIDPEFLNLSFDPDNKHCVPYFWGVTGLAVNTKHVPGLVDSWKILWDERYRGRITMLDDPREGMVPALAISGYSLNTTDPAQVERARNLMSEQRPLVKGYTSYTYGELLRSEEVWIAEAYTGGAHDAAVGKPEIKFVIPKEGSDRAIDSMCIPRNSSHQELALKFINYLLRADVGAAIANEIRYPSPNRAARAHINQDLLNDPSIYPPKEVMNHLEFLQDLGAGQQLYDHSWSELKAQ